jgi:hypothetical protein
MDQTPLTKADPTTKPQPVPRSSCGPPPEGGTLRLTRKTSGGWFVSFTVEVDGVVIGKLAYGKTLEVQLSFGEHLLDVSGGGTFFGATEQLMVHSSEILVYSVCYSWSGGTLLSRVG